jgi:hypothetical protein
LPGEIAALALDPRVARRPITVGEFLRMGDVGILNPCDRVELIEGELRPRSGPITRGLSSR